MRPAEPAFWLFLALLAIGGYFFSREQSLMSSLGDAYLLSWFLVLVYAVPVALLIYRLDLFEREPTILVAAALVWGAVIATSLAAIANGAWLDLVSKVAPPDFAAQWGKAIVGPGVEETLKLAGVAILYLIASEEFDGPMDGFVYGAMVGLGFTVVEDVSYFINAVASAPGAVDQAGPVFDTFLIRVVGGGLYGHVLFTGLTATGFAYLVTRRAGSGLKRLGAFACIGAGVLAHVVWNSPLMDSILRTADGSNPSTLQWIEYGAVKGLPFLALLIVLVVFATRSEEKAFRAIVAGESDPSVITEPEIRSLRNLLARRAARSDASRRLGPLGGRLMGRLQAAQIRYALLRSGGASSDASLERQRETIRAIRGQLDELRPGGVTSDALPMGASSPGAIGSGAMGAAAADPAAADPAAADPAAADPAATRPAATRPAATSPSGEAGDQLESPPSFAPGHRVPGGGLPAWSAPDSSQPPLGILPEGLPVVVESWAGAWAHVRASNGWTGWLDGRLLVPIR